MSFAPEKHLIKVQGGREYLPVAPRIIWFREERPDWAIETEFIVLDFVENRAVCKATIRNEEGRVIAQATKVEDANGFGDFAEKAETGSIGRALALCGFGTQFVGDEMDEGIRLADAPAWNQSRPQQRQSGYPDRTAQAHVSYGHARGGEKAASEKQIGLLKRLGYKGPTEGLSMREAMEIITRLKEGPQDPAPADYLEPVAPPPLVRREKAAPTRLNDPAAYDDMDDPFAD